MDLSNFEGFKLRFKEIKKTDNKKTCVVCKNLFEELDKYVKIAEKKLKKIEFNNFLVGTKLTKKLVGTEEWIWENAGIEWCEPIKSELNRLMGKELEKRFKKPVEFKKPEVVVTLNLRKKDVDLSINSLYLYGEYNKFVRNIPQ
ncbi:MAG: tRNA pseudouridine(54/55) synthase Pus10, partial [Thermotogae bacterium]